MNEDLNKAEIDDNSLSVDIGEDNHGANLEEKDYGRENEDDSLDAKDDDLEVEDDSLEAKGNSRDNDKSNLDKKNDNLDMKSDSLESFSKNKKDKTKIIFRIVVLIIILGFGTWLTIFFLKDSASNYSFYNSENVNENNFLENNNINDNTLEGESSEALASRPVTVIDNDYRMSVPAPVQSLVVKAEDIPSESIKITGTDNGFSPQEFSVSPGQEITLSLTAQSASPVVLTFYDSRMAAVSIGCGPGDTRYVTFRAPEISGEYLFINDVFGKRDQEGKMIVR